MEIKINHTYKVEKKVTENLLACAVGSGDVAVFATPMMIALMEESASKGLGEFLEDGQTSVGISISSSHVAATPCGMGVYSIAKIVNVEGKKVSFQIEAYDDVGLIGSATHERFIVDKSKFEEKAQTRA